MATWRRCALTQRSGYVTPTRCVGPGLSRRVIPLPPEGWDLADAVRVGGRPEQWFVAIPLWTSEEGRSDLTLEATVEDRTEGPS